MKNLEIALVDRPGTLAEMADALDRAGVHINCPATGFVHSRRLTACARPEADHWLATVAVASGIGIELPSSRPWSHPKPFR